MQKRLNGEALEEYVKPIGGGYFFALPGVKTADQYLGQSLLKPDDYAPLYSGAFPDIRMNEQIIFYDRYETEIILSSLCKRLSLVIR